MLNEIKEAKLAKGSTLGRGFGQLPAPLDSFVNLMFHYDEPFNKLRIHTLDELT